jgi:hypothetical protein
MREPGTTVGVAIAIIIPALDLRNEQRHHTFQVI